MALETDTSGCDITSSQLLAVHKETESCTKTTTNILNILDSNGGINKILEDYLTVSQLQLSTIQMNKIHKILSSTAQNESDNADKDIFYYTFCDKETYLHSFFGTKWAEQILKILQSKYSKIPVFLTLFIYLFVRQLAMDILRIYMVSVNCLWIPLGICWILSSNINAFKLVTSTFEFWFKAIYAFLGGLFQIYYYSMVQKTAVLPASFAAFDLIMVVIAMSLFDALHTNTNWKIAISTATGILFSFLAISTQLTLDPDNDESIVRIGSRKISLLTLIISSWRIIAIFSWKQAILTYKNTRKHKNKCIMIHISPSIQWKDIEYCMHPFNNSANRACGGLQVSNYK